MLVGGGADGAKCFAAVLRPAAGVGGVEHPRRVMSGGAASSAPAGKCSLSGAPPDRASCARALVGGGAVGAKFFAAVLRPAAGVGGVERPRRMLSGGAGSLAPVGEAVVCCP